MPRIRGVNHLDAVRALEKAGFRVVRQSEHIVMSNGQRIVTVVTYPANRTEIAKQVIDACVNHARTLLVLQLPAVEAKWSCPVSVDGFALGSQAVIHGARAGR